MGGIKVVPEGEATAKAMFGEPSKGWSSNVKRWARRNPERSVGGSHCRLGPYVRTSPGTINGSGDLKI